MSLIFGYYYYSSGKGSFICHLITSYLYLHIQVLEIETLPEFIKGSRMPGIIKVFYIYGRTSEILRQVPKMMSQTVDS